MDKRWAAVRGCAFFVYVPSFRSQISDFTVNKGTKICKSQIAEQKTEQSDFKLQIISKARIMILFPAWR